MRRGGLALVAVAAIATAACSVSGERPFDSDEWKQSGRCPGVAGERTRDYMVADLTKNHLRVEMTKPQVRRLLGGPENEGDKYWGYGLDSSTILSDCYYLHLIFDDRDRLADWGEEWKDEWGGVR